MRHINLPVFIPHLGCPNDCVFCNQRTISGTHKLDIASIPAQIEEKLASLPAGGNYVELAYFGGSFTGIERSDMRFLLGIARRLLGAGRISAVRVSTRPDYIDAEIIAELKTAGVSTVELGVQSMSDAVLATSRRGHASADTVRAFGLLRAAGLSVVGQMMIGLPRSTGADETATARAICELGAAGARIYPLAVLRATELERMVERGEYTPLPLDEAVSRTADALEVFAGRGVKVLRVGLCASEELFSDDGIAAGEYSPAMGELAMGELYLRRIKSAAAALGADPRGRTLSVSVPRGAVSKAVGQRGANRAALIKQFGAAAVKFTEDAELGEYEVEVKIIL